MGELALARLHAARGAAPRDRRIVGFSITDAGTACTVIDKVYYLIFQSTSPNEITTMIKNDLFKVHLSGEDTLVDVWLSKTICLLNVNLQVAKKGNLQKARAVHISEIGGNFYSTNPNESCYGGRDAYIINNVTFGNKHV